jgi:hypothetical protein
MRAKGSVVLRLAVVFTLTLGVVSLMGLSASAQASTVNCNGILEDGTIVQGDCQVELVDDTGVCQVTLPDGSIAQGQNDSACEALEANTCPSQVILDDGSILQITCDEDEDTETTTDTDTTTDTGTDTTTDTGTDTTTDVEELPETGAGVTQDQGNASALLLAVAGILACIGAFAWQQRHSA